MTEAFMPLMLLLILTVLSLAALLAAFRLAKRDESLADRLEGEKSPRAGSDAASPGASAADDEPEGSLARAAAALARAGEKLAGTEKSRTEARRLLAQAGFAGENALGLYLIAKALLGVMAAGAAFFIVEERSIGTIALMLALYVAAGLVPEWALKVLAARRYAALERSMPDALDLMVICAEAGLPFTRIVKVVSKELELSAPELAEELALTNAELEIMPERAQALRNLAARTCVPSIESMVATLIQAEQFGTPLAQALHNIASESRSTLILTLEERAGKLPARLSIPLMTLILPPVVAIVAAPAIMRVIRTLMN